MRASSSIDGKDAESTGQDLFFSEVVERYVVANPRFIERRWLEERVLAAFPEPSSFLLLTAEPGAGKSAFLAQLARKHPAWLRYFIRRDQRSPLADVSARSFLLRIGYQLAVLRPELFAADQLRLSVSQRVGETSEGSEIVGAEVARLVATPFQRKAIEIEQQVGAHAGRLTGLSIGELVIEPRLLSLEDLLYLALFQPATALTRLDPRGRIVILIDALDEIAFHRETDNIVAWLANCKSLPDNIRFVLTSRPGDTALGLFRQRQAGRVRHLELTADAVNLAQDLRSYADHLVREPSLAGSFTQAQVRGETFAERAIAKANGNIGYLDALAHGLDHATAQKNGEMLRSLLQLTDIPDDLQGLYSLFFHMIKAEVAREIVSHPVQAEQGVYEAVWPAIYDRIIGVLAVAMEPLDEEQIQALGGIRANRSALLAALDRLRQFLLVSEGRYRFYHSTLPEYLLSEATRASSLDFDLYQNARERHAQIAMYYWRSWQQRQDLDSYGLSNLTSHLYEAGEYGTLEELLDEKWMHQRVRRANDSYEEFNRDVDLLWRHARDTALQDDGTAGAQAAAVRLCLRCALIRTTQNSLSGSYLPELVSRALEVGAWSTSRALTVADQIPYLAARAAVYRAILTAASMSMTAEQRKGAQAAAVAAARQVEGRGRRAALLADLGEREELDALVEKVYDEMLQGDFDFTSTMFAVPKLKKEKLAALLRAAAEIGDVGKRLKALSALVHSADEEGIKTLKRAAADPNIRSLLIQSADGLGALRDDPGDELSSMGALGSLLQDEQLDTILSSLLENGKWTAVIGLTKHGGSSLLRRIIDLPVSWRSSWLLSSLAPMLTSGQAEEILRCLDIPDVRERAVALGALIPRLRVCPEDIALDALSSIASIGDDYERDRLLTDLLPYLQPGQLKKAVELSRYGAPRSSQVAFMVKLAERISDGAMNHLVEQALELALRLEDHQSRNYKLMELAPHLNEAQVDEVLKLAGNMLCDEYDKAQLLAALASVFNDRQRDDAIALSGTLSGTSYPSDESIGPKNPREEVLIALAPYLTAAQVIRAMEPRSTLEPYQCTRTLLGLVPFAGERRAELLGKAMKLSGRISSAWLRANVFTQEFPWLSAAERALAANEALTSALEVEDENLRQRSVCELIPHIPDRETLLRVLASVDGIHGDKGRADVLVALVARLDPQDLHKVLDVCFRLESVVARARVVMSVAVRTTDAITKRDIARAFRSAWRAEDSVESAIALAILTPQVGKVRTLAADVRIYFAILSIDETERSSAIASLTPHMRAQRFERMLKLAVDTELDYVVLEVIEGMGSKLRPEQVPVALEAARVLVDPFFHAGSLVAIAPHLNEDMRREALRAILQVDIDANRSNLIERITPYLSTELLDSVLESEWPPRSNELYICEALAAPASKYNSRQLDRVLSVASGFQEEMIRGFLISALVPFLSESQMELARRYVACMESAKTRFECILVMARRGVPSVTESEIRRAFVEFMGSQSLRGDAETLLREIGSFLGSPDTARLDPPTICLIAEDILDVARWRWL